MGEAIREHLSAGAAGQRLGWVDIARGIGMLLIIEGHLGVPSPLTDLAFSVHVPLFFLISGYLAKPGRAGAAARYARRLLVPYLATGAAIAIIEAAKAFFGGGLAQAASVLLEWLAATAFGSGTAASPVLGIHMIGATWFLLALFFALVAYERIHDSRYAWPIVLALFAIGVASARFWWLPWSLQPACTALLFIHIGHRARARGFDPTAASPWVIAACFAVWVAALVIDHGEMYIVSNHFRFLPLDLAGALAATVVICRASACIEAIRALAVPLRAMGRNSLPIMCFHLVELTCIPWWDIAALFGLGWRRLTFLLVFLAKVIWSNAWAFICLRVPVLGALFLGGATKRAAA